MGRKSTIIPDSLSSLLGLVEYDGLEPDAGNLYLYFLISSGVVVYVGVTSSLRERVKTHAKDKNFDRVIFRSGTEADLAAAECDFIETLSPPYNQRRNIYTKHTRQPGEKIDATKIRLCLGLSKSEFAARLGVTQMTVWRWENGKAKPHSLFRKKLLRLQAITEVDK